MTEQSKAQRIATSLGVMTLGLSITSDRCAKLKEAQTHILTQEVALTTAKEALQYVIDRQHHFSAAIGPVENAIGKIEETLWQEALTISKEIL